MDNANMAQRRNGSTAFEWMFRGHVSDQTLVGYRDGLLRGESRPPGNTLDPLPGCQDQLSALTPPGCASLLTVCGGWPASE